jgi:DNA-binding GntR family transcriptional regulator
MNSNLERFDFTFNEYAGQSKARQIASAIELAIYKGVKQFSAARKTVVKAYHHLIEKGVVESQSRQGYFVLHNRSKAKIRGKIVKSTSIFIITIFKWLRW